MGQYSLMYSIQRKVFQLEVSCDMFWTEDWWAVLLYYQGHLQDTLWLWGVPWTYAASIKCQTGMGDKVWFQVCSPQVQSHAFHCTTISGSETPHSEDWKHTSASGGGHFGCSETRSSDLRSTQLCWRHIARKLSTPSQWSFNWSGRGQRHTPRDGTGHCWFQIWL